MSTIKEIIAAQKAAEEQSLSQKKATAQKIATAQTAESKSRGKQASASEAEQAVFFFFNIGVRITTGSWSGSQRYNF